MAALTQYHWMTIAAIIFGFFMAFGIGANDVANAFATSVSAKSISLKQAVLIASICEFLGAFLLGASVTSTIRSKVIDVDLYTDEPDVLMYGMLCSLVSASFILMVANYLSLPVSTTHTIVGAIIGFSIAAQGFSSVNWWTTGQIFISWVASPVITGIVAFILFWIIRKFVMLHENAYKRAIVTYPVVLFVAITLDLFFILYKSGTNNPNKLKEYGLKLILPVSFGAGLFCAAVFFLFISPCIQKKIEREGAAAAAAAAAALETPAPEDPTAEEGDAEIQKNEDMDKTTRSGEEEVAANPSPEEAPTKPTTVSKKLSGVLSKSYASFADATFNRDLEAQAMSQSERAREIWANAEVYNDKAEQMFSYLQVFTACLMSFSHGANDVANAIAPISAVFLIYETGEVSSKAPVQKSLLALGGAGIVVGLLLYGYKLMIALGYHLTKLSPSKGFCIELSSSFVVVIASFIGIPISTTQCQVGGTTGAGFVGGGGHVDMWFFVKCMFGWVGTFLGVVLINCGVFAFAYFAPSAAGYS